MSAATLSIRAATVADAPAVGALVREFQEYLRGLGDPTSFAFTAETYARDGFGADPAFAGLVAERGGAVIAYLLYHFGYDTDRALRLTYVIDLFVSEAHRGSGAGGALMRAAAEISAAAGARALTWSVFRPNLLAFRFYEGLGAMRINDLEFMWVPADTLRSDRRQTTRRQRRSNRNFLGSAQ